MKHCTSPWSGWEGPGAFRSFGCHPQEGQTLFRVWAPEAEQVFVTGAFCSWDPRLFPMEQTAPGVFEALLTCAEEFDAYKYAVQTPDGQLRFKSDPFAVHAETPPGNASKVYFLENYQWNDARWMARRASGEVRPLNLYEIHAGSFRTYANGEPLNYRNLAGELSAYLKDMGFTGVCLMPLLEHLDGASGGYRTTGFFAPTSRYGTPSDFLDLVNALHQADLSVWMEWSPEGFPADDFGLSDFAGAPLFECPEDAERPDFRRFDYENPAVREFLFASARFLLEVCHIDGLRICGDRRIASRPGGREFLQELNRQIPRHFPGARTAGAAPDAEPSLLWDEEPLPALLRFAAEGGQPPAFPAQGDRRLLAAGRQFLDRLGDSLMGWIPGSYEEKFARLRAVMTVFYGAPGRKLLFMGSEFAQFSPWTPAHELDWMLLDYEMHRKFQSFFRQLNDFYRKTPAIWQSPDLSPIAFPENPALLGFSRRDEAGNEFLVLANFGKEETPIELGVDRRGKYTELFSSDEIKYGGGGRLNGGGFAKLRPAQGKPFCVDAVLPPLSAVYFFKSAGIKPRDSI